MDDQWITVKQGECVESLAYQAGHVLATVWDHPQNAALKTLRKNPHTLLPGDTLFVPAIRPKNQVCATDNVHRFRRKEVPARVVIVLANARELANLPFELRLGTATFKGVIDADGTLSAPVMPDVPGGELLVDPAGRNLRFALGMRQLDPISETSGIQGRLQNLGFYTGPLDGLYTQALAFSIQRFQQSLGLGPSGALDDALRDALLNAHGG